MAATSPNQITITKLHYEPCNKDNLYATMNIEAMQAAMNDLTTMGALKLWCYLSKNQSTYENFGLSQVACAEWGLKRSAYYDAKKELLAKGYLVELDATHMEFIQFPKSGNRKTEREESEIRNSEESVEDFPKIGIRIPDSGKSFPNFNREILQDNTTGDSTIKDNTHHDEFVKVEKTYEELMKMKRGAATDVEVVGMDKEWVYVSISGRKMAFRA